MSEDLGRFNSLSPDEAAALLLPCCGSRAWARRMAEGRPFQGDRRSSGKIRSDLAEPWRRGLAGGLRRASADRGEGEPLVRAGTGRSAGRRTRETLAELIEANRIYETRFDHIFIVCATGKSAAEMLGLLRARLDNDSETELRLAAEEQRKITNLRLEKLFS